LSRTSRKFVNRSAAPAALPPLRVQTSSPTRVQGSAPRVSSPSDPAEREAEDTARRVVRMPTPEQRTLRLAGVSAGLARQGLSEEEREKQRRAAKDRPMVSPYLARFAEALPVRRKAEGQPDVGGNVAAELSSSLSSGSPLPAGVRRFMEPRFGADFSNVRVHTGTQASGLARQFNAQAFAYGNHIFFGKDRFQPETSEGRELVAHELTHTIQQGGAVQRAVEPAAVSQRTTPHVQRLGISDALDYFAEKANVIPGFRMFTIVLGVNPINMSRVERSGANVLRAIVEFIPGGGLVTQALDNYGVFEKAGAWVEQQVRTLGMTGAAIKNAVMEFLDSLGWRDIFRLGDVWRRARRIFTDPIDRIISFASGLITGILRFIREAILRPLASLAQGTRGYDLLKAVLGEDPVTGDPYPRNADTLIGGFMTLIGQQEIWENIKKSGAIARCWAWFQGALGTVLGFVRQIPQLFISALKSLELVDLVLVPRAFAKVARVFGAFVGSFISWAGGAVWNLLEIIFSVVAPGVMPYLRKAAGAFRTILNNPIGFVGNLVRAGKAGFNQFAKNILTHLKTSLIQWLTGSLGGLAIYIPQSFDIREIVKFVLSVLGLTWANIRQKLVKAVGETAVKALETGFDIVMTLVTQGPAAAWEKIKEQLANLKELILDEIMNFVVVKVVQSAIVKLVSMLNPAGAFIQAIIATYNTVMFFVERLRQIVQVTMAFIDSISAIASGVIAAAANKVESTLAGLLTLAISFLARLVGLGKVSDVVVNIVNKIRAPIDKALDKVVDWIVAGARKIGRFIAQAGLPQDPGERLKLGMAAATAAANRFAGKGVGAAVLLPLFGAIKTRYGFTELVAVPERGRWVVEGAINPRSRNVTDALIEEVRERQAADEDFDPAWLTTAEMRRLYDAARRLGLDNKTIKDLLFIAGRREKPITAEGLLAQMNHWVRVVNPRGFPYRFDNLSRFQEFTDALIGGVRSIALPTSDVRIQGSALRNPAARDVDVAIMLSAVEFDALLVRSFNEVARFNGSPFLARARSLAAVAADIQRGTPGYNALARTFEFAYRNRKIRPQDVEGLDGLRSGLQADYGPLDISVMTVGGNLELSPFLRLR
jgi:hypothetical protein